MTDIRAFVGHSFLETDREVVRAFTDHFNTLAKAGIGFTWDHAEEAEALPLSDKVLAKIDGKNVFIGICTRREYAIEPSKLKRWFGFCAGGTGDFSSKTSDWIIQEIGLAVGREMRIILLLEDGVRDPGGLYGNTEYIRFSRDRLSDCFDRFLQMVNGLRPKLVTATSVEAQPSTGTKPEEEEVADGSDLEPKLDWDAEAYSNALVRAVLENDKGAIDLIDSAFKASIHAQGDQAIVWEGRLEYYRLLFLKIGSFEKMKRLAEDHSNLPEVLYFAASAYEQYEDYASAISKYEQAAVVAKEETDKVRYLGHAAYLYARTGYVQRAAQLMNEIKRKVAKDPKLEPWLVSDLKRLATHEKDSFYELVLLEHEVETRPDDFEKRFSLAYLHSQNDNRDMALHHYLKIPVIRRDSMTWNNIGVSYGEFSMPVSGVRAFKRAADENNTLAMSNLGNKYLSSGFFDEADAQCKRALALPNYDKNIPILLNRLTEVQGEEDKKLNDALEKVKAKVAFFRQLARNVILETPSAIATQWVAKECSLNAELSNDLLTLVGSYEMEPSGLASILAGVSFVSVKYKYEIQYSGRLRGRMFIGSVVRKKEGGSANLLEGTPIKTLMYLSPDASELHVMENCQSTNPTFYVLRALS